MFGSPIGSTINFEQSLRPAPGKTAGLVPCLLIGEPFFNQSTVTELIIAHGAAGRAAFGNNGFRRGPVNVAVITLNETRIQQ